MYHRRDRRIGLYIFYTLTKMCACKLSQYTRNAVLLFRIPEASYVIITAGVAYALVSSGRIIPSSRMQIPDINFSNAGSNFIAQNPVNSYPIQLSGFACYAPELNACIIAKQSGEAMSQGCCAELYDSSVEPYQQIPNPLLWILAIIIPFLIFIARVAIWRYYIGRQWSSHSLLPTNTVLSLQSVLQCIFSIPSQTLDQLLVLHYASIRYGSGDVATTHAIYSNLGMTPQEKKKHGVNDVTSAQRSVETNNTNQREELSYEIIDSAGNSVGRPRDIENAGGMADPVSVESQSDSFLSNKLGMPGPTAAPPSPLQHMFWLLLLYEPSAGLAISLVFQGIICQALKRYVGAPRPNYYALSAWASVYDNRAVDAISARMSFPSGHSATAAAGLGFVVLVLLNDVRKLKSRHWKQSMQDSFSVSISTASVVPTGMDGAEDRVPKICDTVVLIVTFTLVSMLCVCVALMIGASRIRDYFHFAPDVIGASVNTILLQEPQQFRFWMLCILKATHFIAFHTVPYYYILFHDIPLLHCDCIRPHVSFYGYDDTKQLYPLGLFSCLPIFNSHPILPILILLHVAGWLIGILTAGLTYSFGARSSTEGPGLHGGATDMVHASLL